MQTVTRNLKCNIVDFCSWNLYKFVCSYNKTERDFKSLREYNDYLEEVETISKLIQ